MKTLIAFLAAAFLSAGTLAAQTFPVDPFLLDFRQVDFAFEGISPAPNSRYGWVSADDSDVLLISTGGLLSQGYLNIATPEGWVVRNLPLDANSPYPGIGTYFDLGFNPGDVAFLNVVAEVSAAPVLVYAPPALVDIPVPVFDMTYNAQGATGEDDGDPTNDRRASNPDPLAKIDLSGVSWIDSFIDRNPQDGHPNIEQRVDQCMPAGVANSLKYLEDTTGVKATNHPHVAGTEGDGSLVGQIGQDMQRVVDKPVRSALDMVRGKMNYLDRNDLEGNLITSHKLGPVAAGWLPATVSSGPDGDPSTATSARDDTATTLIDWIIARVKEGCDVEIRIGWSDVNAAGNPINPGHCVQLTDAGKIFGVPYIKYAHDAAQGDNTKGTGKDDGGHGFTFVTPGLLLPGFIDGKVLDPTLDFAVAETTVKIDAEETPRFGTPPAPPGFFPGLTPPLLGQTWDPVVDHAIFEPGAVLDLLAINAAPANIPSPIGTILCDPLAPTIIVSGVPGSPFAVPVPPAPELAGKSLCSQVISVDPLTGLHVTNALDIVLGTK